MSKSMGMSFCISVFNEHINFNDDGLLVIKGKDINIFLKELQLKLTKLEGTRCGLDISYHKIKFHELMKSSDSDKSVIRIKVRLTGIVHIECLTRCQKEVTAIVNGYINEIIG